MKKKSKKRQVEVVKEAMPKWYASNRRNLPWRRHRDPYAIWVSEVMLQQTRVAQAIPYYKRFMAKFPDVYSLAKAPLDDLLKVWEGMGYYSRARNLHCAAKQVVEEYGGRLPETAEELLALPGIGKYTAGAIASIAFDLDEPVLDGNVTRVLCRIFAVKEDPKAQKTQNLLWSLARELIPEGKAGAFNQGLMELGAMVCLPRKPLCDECPVEEICRARIQKIQEELPLKKKKKKIPHKIEVAGVIWKNGKILIARRKPEGLLGGLWEIPGGEPPNKTKEKDMNKKQGKGRGNHGEERRLEEALPDIIRNTVGIEVRIKGLLAAVTHVYSHFRVTLNAFTCTWQKGRARAIENDVVKWVDPANLERYAFPAVVNKVLEEIKYGEAP